jgi:hypothetical protein
MWPCGKAKRSNILALFALTRQKFMYLGKSFIAPAIHLIFNWYPQATAPHLSIVYLQLKLSDKIHKEAAETLTHSVLLFVRSLDSPCFDCIDHLQHFSSLSHGLWCRLNVTPLVLQVYFRDPTGLLDNPNMDT